MNGELINGEHEQNGVGCVMEHGWMNGGIINGEHEQNGGDCIMDWVG